jgi:hypothetical protein
VRGRESVAVSVAELLCVIEAVPDTVREPDLDEVRDRVTDSEKEADPERDMEPVTVSVWEVDGDHEGETVMVLVRLSVPVSVEEAVQDKELERVIEVVIEPVSLLTDTVIDSDSVRGNVTVALLVMDCDKELEMVAVVVWDTDPEGDLVGDSVQERESLALTDPVIVAVCVAETVEDLESVMDEESVPVGL